MFSRWTKGLAALGWRVTHIAPNEGFVPRFPDGADYVPIDMCRGYVNRLRQARRVLEPIERANPDLILFPDPELLTVLPGYGRRKGIPVVFDRHENFEDPGTLFRYGGVSNLVARAYGYYEHWIAPRLAGVIVVLEDMIENLHPKAAVQVAHNFPTREVVDALSGPSSPGSRSFTCVNLGSLHIERGLYEQLEVARTMIQDRQRSDFSLCIGGSFPPGSLERCRSFVLENGLKNSVRLVESFLPHDEVIDMYRAAEIGFSPYLNNRKSQITLQNKVLEFMGAGLPVITSPSSMNGQVIEESGGGALFWADQTGEICDQIEAWMDDPTEAQRVGERGRQYLLKHLIWEAELERVDSWFKDLCRSTER